MTRIEAVFKKFPILKRVISECDLIDKCCPDDFTPEFKNDKCDYTHCKECWNKEAAND